MSITVENDYYFEHTNDILREFFEYTSFCPLHSPYGNMRGEYQMVDESGITFMVTIPVFFFRPIVK